MQAGKLTNMNFSSRFRELLESCGKTQKEVAEALGLSEGALINYKRESVPKSMELLAISRFFGVSMEWLLTGEGAAGGNSTDAAVWRQKCQEAERRLEGLKSGVLTLVKKF